MSKVQRQLARIARDMGRDPHELIDAFHTLGGWQKKHPYVVRNRVEEAIHLVSATPRR